MTLEGLWESVGKALCGRVEQTLLNSAMAFSCLDSGNCFLQIAVHFSKSSSLSIRFFFSPLHSKTAFNHLPKLGPWVTIEKGGKVRPAFAMVTKESRLGRTRCSSKEEIHSLKVQHHSRYACFYCSDILTTHWISSIRWNI